MRVRSDTPVRVHSSVGEKKVVSHNFLRSVFRVSVCLIGSSVRQWRPRSSHLSTFHVFTGV